MGPLGWAFILLAAGLMFICLEFLIPSGGILGVLAVAALVGSIVMGFVAGTKWGVIMLGINAVMVPGVLALAVKVWPHTPLGRRMLIQLPQSQEDVLPPVSETLRSLVGRKGIARTKMLPSGAISVDGRSYDAVSEGMPIDQGQVVRVVAVRSNRIVVRPSEGPLPDHRDRETDQDPRLEEPLDKFGLEPLDDPLA